jgi:hypothetical protein
MALRTPLKFNGTDIIEMSDAEVADIQRQVKHLYGTDPAIKLTYVASSGTLGAIIDTRRIASPAVTSTTSYDAVAPSGAEADNFLAVSHAKISQNAYAGDSATAFNALATTADTGNIAFPCYYDSANVIINAMTDSDVLDTFIKPALASYDTSSNDDSFGGAYHLQTATSFSGSQLVNANPIFFDTRADGSAYTAEGITEVQDQPTTITNYYLHKVTPAASAAFNIPLHVDSTDGTLSTPDSAAFNGVLANMVRYASKNITGAKISYAFYNDSDTTGTQRGTAIVNTQLNALTLAQRQQNVDDYREQNIPSGTAVTINTYYLGVTVT